MTQRRPYRRGGDTSDYTILWGSDDSDNFLNETKSPSQVKRKITMDNSTKLSTFVCNSRSIIMGNSEKSPYDEGPA